MDNIEKDNYKQEINSLHHKAMDIADEAHFLEKVKKLPEEAKEKWNSAFIIEMGIANYLKDMADCEPTRSVITRSAGWLALNAGLVDKARECAERVIEFGYGEIADEGRELLETVKEIENNQK